MGCAIGHTGGLIQMFRPLLPVRVGEDFKNGPD
nr:MAG TPA: hypothetical protein [Caudoviricetes sp.]